MPRLHSLNYELRNEWDCRVGRVAAQCRDLWQVGSKRDPKSIAQITRLVPLRHCFVVGLTVLVKEKRSGCASLRVPVGRLVRGCNVDRQSKYA
jgi:hypothetical protein